MTDEDTLAAFGAEVERWVRANLAAMRASGRWYAELSARGWLVPHWPVEFGGAGLSSEESAVVRAVLAKYRADLPPQHFVPITLVGPGLLTWGTTEQQRRYLPGIASGADMWCQLFSEPGAGSDLASLATRAVPTDDGRWIVTGQKVWSSFADISRYGLLLARTDPDRPKNAGLTCFLLDMSLPGVTVRPLRQLTGDEHFCEVFLDEVEVSDAARLGPAHEGWRVALSTLHAERSGLSGDSEAAGVALGPVLAAARSSGAWCDPVVRDRLTGLIATQHALSLTTRRVRPGDARGSVTKLVQSELAQRICELTFETAGPAAACWDGDELGPEAFGLLDSRRLTIAGGTSEIQRTIIAERVLGLDREPDPDRGRPWRDLRRG
ncbi:acyl-CoA dehydrogenase family protein [Nocardia sp. CDC159]|uniref:Acyl-CoA dehydrogenase family protein n=1 Tax=Nocardia pulmonis TaxID=2951408 RepID=A0A9X2E1M3_9NOCA|nr:MULTISPECIES: acyl-CoA dehydrogenase family protein [Nocardia]MCM6772557.1 acyl-CoA dehydrogenase family protein [Nocardia pulmonis]MCM6784785.1 acyl-CoA dehydrogenase family protein [Nocardia sp. CDC159]